MDYKRPPMFERHILLQAEPIEKGTLASPRRFKNLCKRKQRLYCVLHSRAPRPCGCTGNVSGTLWRNRGMTQDLYASGYSLAIPYPRRLSNRYLGAFGSPFPGIWIVLMGVGCQQMPVLQVSVLHCIKAPPQPR